MKEWARHKIEIEVQVQVGSWSSLDDLLTYIKYRLDMRSRSTDAIKLNGVKVVSSYNVQEEF